MPLSPGARLGGYEVLSLIGAGGMGEVYRARDTRLNRDVALKILPPQTGGSPTAFARFEREAQAVAALSHPNILAVHDFGRTDEAAYVVFELLQGATLRERLTSGPLPVRKAIDYARQVADGLAAAHARGIAHRDIKPDNLFVTDDGRVKILDFGLAQTGTVSGEGAHTIALTQAPITDAGTVLGTVGYMAPEQVRGLGVDHRADLFALGCVLYEMCTGQRAFKGATPADTMTAVLSSDPPELTLSGQPTPPALDRIVRRCLEKQPTERFQSARDLSFALEALSSLSGPARDGTAASSAVEAPGRVRVWLPLLATAAAALVLGAAGARALWPSSPTPDRDTTGGPLMRLEFESPSNTVTTILLGLSPDGRYVSYTHASSGVAGRQLMIRDLGTGQAEPVPDSRGGWGMAWSPRSDGLVFSNLDGELRLYTLGERSSRPVVSLSKGSVGLRGFAWLADDTLVFVTRADGVQRVPLGGGPTVPVVNDPTLLFGFPSTIGHSTTHVLAFRSQANEQPPRHIVAIELATGRVTPIVENDAAGIWAAPGHILLPRANGLFAAPFDAERLSLTADPVFVTDPARWDGSTGAGPLASSVAGLIAFRPQRDTLLQYEWLDQAGRSLGRVGPPAFYGSFALSRDGTRIVSRVLSETSGRTSGLTVIDLERGVSSPVEGAGGALSDPIWTADGARILYRRNTTLVSQSPYGNDAKVLRDAALYPDDTSADGRWLLIGRPRDDSRRGFGVFAIPVDGKGEERAVSEGPFQSDEASFSPDGRWISFQSDLSGRTEIYVTRFPSTGERWQLSPDGGVQARWSPDGRALYYLSLSGHLMRVPIPGTGPAEAGKPEVLFDSGLGAPAGQLEQYAVFGDRFLFQRRAPESEPETIAVIANWTRLLAQQAGLGK